jgi:hypothetical protein
LEPVKRLRSEDKAQFFLLVPIIITDNIVLGQYFQDISLLGMTLNLIMKNGFGSGWESRPILMGSRNWDTAVILR